MKTIKLSLHNHTYMSDGYFSPEELLKFLHLKGFDVVAITDHRVHTIPAEVPEGLLFIDGIEYWSDYHRGEIVGLAPDISSPVLSSTKLAWFAHPKYYYGDLDFMRKCILGNESIYGAELWNNRERQLDEDREEQFGKEGALLFAVDDLHVPSQVMYNWMEMEVDSVDVDTVVENLKSGDFWLMNRNPESRLDLEPTYPFR